MRVQTLTNGFKRKQIIINRLWFENRSMFVLLK